jgi:ribonucrease Y
MMMYVLIALGAALMAAAAALGLRLLRARLRAQAESRVSEIISDAESRTRTRLMEADLEAEERRSADEARFEEHTRKKRDEMQRAEERLREQERNVARKLQLLGQKQQEIDERDARLREREERTATLEREAQTLVLERRQRLERIAGTSARDAHRELIREIETEARQEAAGLVRRIEDEAQNEASGRARRVVAEAIQRLPASDLVDGVVTMVKLPNDDMKGRIIGREGRNIRALEMATGVDVIVDDTPLSIVLSSFDPFRRAVAKHAIERLIEDGRIHPARIEEMVARARAEMEESLDSLGEGAAFDLGITGLPQRLQHLLGKLKYRVVLGYNLLDHSVEVARLAAQMAILLGLHPEVVKRAGLLHEIGQVEESRADTHPILVSADLAARLNEDPRVVQTIRALHGTGSEPSIDAAILRVAEKAIVARPGGKDTTLQGFMERMRSLEAIASSFHGVSRAFVLRSGKEVRVLVEAGAVNDAEVVTLSKEITSRIQKEVEYPGAVRISVIRETRAVDYAT